MSPIYIATPEECEQADICVCMRVGTGDETRFDDNEYGECADCGHAIYFRPYNPKTPIKLCAQCAMKRAGIPDETVQQLKDEGEL